MPVESSKTSRTLVLFDFDGTLTTGDTLVRFLLFAVPPARLITGGARLFFQYLGLVFQGKWSNERAKAQLLAVFFQHQQQEDLEALGARFCAQKLPGLFRADLLNLLRDYRRQGATIALVSASPDLWLKPFAAAENIQLICTELDYAAGRFSGKFATPNCNGAEKARRIQAVFQLSDFEKIIAYGNSSGDEAMFALAHASYRV